jgi:chromosome partitioning protein
MQATKKPFVIVFGNEKGGSGKSTVALHVVVGLLQRGLKVGSLDLDSRQATLTRFFQNRFQRVSQDGLDLPCPVHLPVAISQAETREQQLAENQANLDSAMQHLVEAGCDVVVMDTPGSDTSLSRLGHRLADMLVTPMIAKINGQTLAIEKPSIYSDMVWEYRKERSIAGAKPMKWLIVRNRLSHLNAHNKTQIAELLAQLERRFAFNFINGFSERVIYRELFLKGLTMMDLHAVPGFTMNMSHLSARQEVRNVLHAMGFADEAASTEQPTEQPLAA